MLKRERKNVGQKRRKKIYELHSGSKSFEVIAVEVAAHCVVGEPGRRAVKGTDVEAWKS